MKSYKELNVWKKSFELVHSVYRVTRVFPREELFALVSQMRRAAISIPSNIAEGCSRKTTREYIQFVQIAFGSAAELETQIALAKELGYLSDEEFGHLNSKTHEVLKMLNGLLSSLKRKSSH
jgi:four helix bundle protein